jgi:AcrR family transcriptional regulator
VSSQQAHPKERLVADAVAYLTEHGLSDVSLRELATGLGTSHRMLIYYFGSKEGLLVEVVREVERRQQSVLLAMAQDGTGSLADVARRFWQALRAPELASSERLFFELYGQALQGRPYAVPFLVGVVDSWVELSIPALRAAGLSDADAHAQARLGLAVVRGLLLDVLATGDGAGVDAAFEYYLAALTSLDAGTPRVTDA